MSKYRLIDDVVQSVYTVEIGLSDEDGIGLFSRMLQQGEWQQKIAPEIDAAFADGGFSWIDFFEEHDLFSTDSEAEALAYARMLLLEPLEALRNKAG